MISESFIYKAAVYKDTLKDQTETKHIPCILFTYVSFNNGISSSGCTVQNGGMINEQ